MFYWSRIPLVRLVIPFILGIIFSHLSILEVRHLNGGLFSFAIFVFVSIYLSLKSTSFKQRWLIGLIISLTFFSLGVCLQLQWQSHHVVPTINDEKEVLWLGKVLEAEIKNDSAFGLMIDVQKVYDSSWKRKDFRLSLYYKGGDVVKKGEVISANSYINRIEKPLNPYQFDYAGLMANRGVYYQAFEDNINQYYREKSLVILASDIRNKLIDNFRSFGIEGKELSVLTAISLGDKSLLGNETRDAYSGAGAMHILAVSGLHVGIIYLIFNTLLSFLKSKKWQRIIKGVTLLSVIWGFAFLTGLSPSVQRAACMFSFIIISNALNRHSNILNSIAGAAFLLLIFNPMIVFEVGFQLSFAAVIGIVSLHPIIYNWLDIPNLIIDKVWSLIVVSTTAQLSTLPFVLYYFHQFPNWFLLTNIFVIPLAFFIVSGAVLVSLLILTLNHDLFLAQVLEKGVSVLNFLISKMEGLPFFVSDGIWLTLGSAIILAASIIFLIFYLNELNYFQLFTCLSLLSIVFMIELSINQRNATNNFFGVYALKGKSVYIKKVGNNAEIISKYNSLNGHAERVIKNHIDALGVEDIKYISFDARKSEERDRDQHEMSDVFKLSSGGINIWLLREKLLEVVLKGAGKSDLVVLSKKNRFIDYEVDKIPGERTVVLDATFPEWTTHSKELYQRPNIHSVQNSGYWSIDF